MYNKKTYKSSGNDMYKDRYDEIPCDDDEDDNGCGVRYEDPHKEFYANYNYYRYEED